MCPIDRSTWPHSPDGGIVTASDSTIGFGENSTGTLTVQEAGSMWTQSDELLTGYRGNGTLNVLDSGYLQVGSNASLGENGGLGTVNMEGAGSLWDVAGDLVVGWDNEVTVNSQSTINLSVRGNNILVARADGSGDFINDGTVNLFASGTLAGFLTTPTATTTESAGPGTGATTSLWSARSRRSRQRT